MMKTGDQEVILKAVRERYKEAAKRGTSGSCSFSGSTCCGTDDSMPESASDLFSSVCSEQQTMEIPDGTDMGLGCGNPITIALLKPGETILDLGCGGGVDCFLAAKAVGSTGRVIGRSHLFPSSPLLP
jgi:arsenite methyltransferase